MGLIIAPVFVGEMLPETLSGSANDLLNMPLYQPNNQENDNTDGEEPTGIKSPNYTGKFSSTASSSPKATAGPDAETAEPDTETADP